MTIITEGWQVELAVDWFLKMTGHNLNQVTLSKINAAQKYTVVRNVVPEFLTHVVMIVSGQNLLLHGFISTVSTERRIACQAAHNDT